MNFYATFSIPFIVGVVTMFVVLIVKYGSWIFGLSAADRMRIVKGIPSRQTPLAVWEVVRESLLHRRIFKVNPLLGYMHMSLAFGWFLLIVVGWIETVAYLGFRYVPLHGHVFFKYFATELPHKPVFDFLMDLLLLFVLSGVTLAFGKRIYSQAMGMRRTTRHVLGDRIALSVLWLIFPARLLAESEVVFTCLNKNVLLLGKDEFAQLGEGKVLFNTSIGPGFDSAALEDWLTLPGTHFFCDTRAAAGPVGEGFFERENVHCANVSAGRTKQAFVLLSQKVLANLRTALGK